MIILRSPLARLLLVLTLLSPALAPAGVAQEAPLEYKVKAAFLFNFAKFTKWPDRAFADEKAPFVIAIVGQDPFGTALDTLAEANTFAGRRIEVRRLAIVDEATPAGSAAGPRTLSRDFVQALKSSHLLFVPRTEAARAPDLLATLKDSATLAVGEQDGFAERGGMVNFYLEQDKIRFEINPEATRRSALEISAKLLQLARIVRDRNSQE